MTVKMRLTRPTKGKKAGEEITVADAATADALVASGSASRIKAEHKKSDKD